MYTLREKQVHAYFNLSKGIEFFKGFISYKTLKCVRGVRLDNRKVLCAARPLAKYFKRLFFVTC